MQKFGRIAAGVLLALVILGSLLTVGVQIILRRNLTTLLWRRFVPAAEAALQVPVEFRTASVNLLPGSAYITNLQIGNPRAFKERSLLSVDIATLQIGRKALIARRLDAAAELRINDAELTLVRSRDWKINIQEVAKALRHQTQAMPEAAGSPESALSAGTRQDAGPAYWPKTTLQSVTANCILRLIDHTTVSGIPQAVVLDLRIHLTDVSTFDHPETIQGTVSIQGALATDPTRCIMDLQGQLSPWIDPAKPGFSLKGTILNFDPEIVKPYLLRANVACQAMDLKLALTCKDGIFEPEDSFLILEMKTVSFSGETARKLPPSLRDLPSLTVTLPLKGAVTDPKVSLMAGLDVALKELIHSMPGGYHPRPTQKRIWLPNLNPTLAEQATDELDDSFTEDPAKSSIQPGAKELDKTIQSLSPLQFDH